MKWWRRQHWISTWMNNLAGGSSQGCRYVPKVNDRAEAALPWVEGSRHPYDCGCDCEPSYSADQIGMDDKTFRRRANVRKWIAGDQCQFIFMVRLQHGDIMRAHDLC